jgi:hypothetical protein
MPGPVRDIHFTRQLADRCIGSERDLDDSLVCEAVAFGHAARTGITGPLGGPLVRFERRSERGTIVVLAELKKSRCLALTAFRLSA